MNLSAARDSARHTRKTLALVWKSSPKMTVCLGLLTVVSAALPVSVAYAGKEIIDAVVARSTAETLRWVGLELAIVAAQAFSQRGLGLIRQLLGARLALDINVRILEKAQTLELRHFEDPEFYDQLTRARREASSRPVSVVTTSFQLVQNVLTLGGYAAVLLSFSPWAVLGLFVAAVPGTLAELRFSKLAFRMRNWRSPESRRLIYLEYVLANDAHAKEVKLFGLGPMLLARYRKLGESFYAEDRGLAVRRAVWAFALSLVGTLAFYGCYAVIGWEAAEGIITLGNLTLYVVAFRQGQQSFQSILTGLGGLYENNLYMSNLFAYLAISTEKVEPAPSTPAQLAPSSSKGASAPEEPERGIRFEHAGFRYPGTDTWALRDLNLFIPARQSLALVGHNGAGKTTLIKLLTKLYSPTEGRVLLDGRDLEQWDAVELRARIGVIFQDFNQYQFTARENVSMGSIAHGEDEVRVRRAVDRGGASEVVAGLSEGLETPLGRWFKDGAQLSGGQWQKVALARAFMREEADILVLDEPTAALDAEAEHALFSRFRKLSEGRTTLLISHRFPTVRMADRILVLEGGRILEDGSHQELIAAGERYARMFSLQAQGYQ